MLRAHPHVLLVTAVFAALPVWAEAFGPAISIGEISFDGPPTAEPYLGSALYGLILGDLLHQVEEGGPYEDCDAVIVDLKSRPLAEAEIKLQQSEYFDPATRLEPGHFIDPTHMLSGHLGLENGQFTWFVEIVDLENGGSVAVTGTKAEDDYLDISGEIARQVAEALCEGTWIASGGSAQITISGWVRHLDEPFTLFGAFQGGNALFTYAPDGPTGGSVSYVLVGSGVTGSGSGTFRMARQPDGTVRMDTSTHGCIDGMPVDTCRDRRHTTTLTPVRR